MKIDILGHTYTVNRTKLKQTRQYGNHCPFTCTIDVNSEFADTVQELTFLHEIMHSIDEFYDAGWTELQIRIMAAGLYQVLSQNNMLNMDILKEK